jgi:hypothetical protein
MAYLIGSILIIAFLVFLGTRMIKASSERMSEDEVLLLLMMEVGQEEEEGDFSS